MSDTRATLRVWLFRVVLPAALVLGVGWLTVRRPPAPFELAEEPTGERLHKIGLAMDAATTRLGRPPASMDELRPFLEDEGDPERLSVSPVDGQPYVLLWGVDVRSAGNDVVLGYERTGSGGKRFVLTSSGVARLTEAELAAASFPNGHRPPGGN